MLYRSLALAFAALVALVLVGVKWWGEHGTFSQSVTASVDQASPAAAPMGGVLANADKTNIVLAVLVTVLLGSLVVLGLRLMRNYRGAVKLARQTTAETEFNEARLMDFVALSSDWLWETDTEHRFTLVSGGIRSIANMDSADFTGRALWDIRARPTDGSQWASHIRKLEQREQFTLLVSRADLTGLVRHLEFTGKPLFDNGKFIGYRGVGRDVTRRLESDRHLRNSEERFRTLVESFYDWYWEQDEQLRFTQLMTSPQNPTPMRTGEVIGKTRWALADAMPEQGDWHDHIEMLERHVPYDGFVYHRSTPTGQRWFSVTGRPTFDSAGRFTGYRGVTRDVTQERQTRQALIASEERYRSTFEMAPVGIVSTDASGRWERVNQTFARMLGHEAEDLTGKSDADFTHPKDVDEDAALFADLRQGRSAIYEREKRFIRSNGAVVWARVTVTAQRDADGAFSHSIAVVQDISEHLMAERERKAIEHRYRQLVDVSPDGIVVHRNGRILFANPAGVKIFGVARMDALLDQPLEQYVEGTGEHPMDASAPAVPGTTIARQQFRIRRADNRVADVECTGVVVEFSDGPAILCLIRDISDSVAAEKALHESRTRYREVVESVNEVIFQADMSGCFQFLNPSWTRVSGHDVEESLGRHMAAFLHPDDRLDVRESIERLLLGKQQQSECELRIRTTEGEVRWLEVHTRVMTSASGEPLGIMGSMDDITTRKVAELTLKNVNIDLESRVRARTAELEASNRELEAFSYSVSHDLRAPLRAIDGFSMILQEDLAGTLDGSARTHLQRIRMATARMAQLIDDLIELARLTRQTLRRENLDLSLMVTTILDDIHQENPGRTLEAEIAPGLSVNADRALMRIALENLLRNAWKFTADEPVARIGFYAIRESENVMFCIADNGIGFDMEYADKLFMPFYRLHASSEFAGSGIGLATVARIIQRHGGTIDADSAPGEGARFYFSIGR